MLCFKLVGDLKQTDQVGVKQETAENSGERRRTTENNSWYRGRHRLLGCQSQARKVNRGEGEEGEGGERRGNDRMLFTWTRGA